MNNSVETEPVSHAKPVKKRQRCSHSLCKTRLTMIDISMECKCGYAFCGKHRLPEYHECKYDHRKEAIEITTKKINESACIASKVLHV